MPPCLRAAANQPQPRAGLPADGTGQARRGSGSKVARGRREVMGRRTEEMMAGQQMRQFRQEMAAGIYGGNMSNNYAASVARDQMTNQAGMYCTPRDPQADEVSRQMLRDEVARHRAKVGMPPAPIHTPAADNGQRQRRSDKVSDPVNQPEYTGGSVSYYRVKVEKPTSKDLPPYEAECNDIIEALNLNYAEGNALKAIWRMAAARMGKMKKGYTDGLYDAEKIEFFGARLVAQNGGK